VFLFDTLDGRVLGWNGGAGTTAVKVSTVAGAVFTGLAIASSAGANYIYAADNTGHITVFDTNFSNVTGRHLRENSWTRTRWPDFILSTFRTLAAICS
jgi:hypothetical protein